MKITWNLRMLCAERGLWTGAALNRRLGERLGLTLTSQTMSNLMTKQPKRLSTNLLLALCAALDCTPNDLLRLDLTPSSKATRQLARDILAANETKAPRRGARRRPARRLQPPPPTRI
jgi:putative transcriptional regulator